MWRCVDIVNRRFGRTYRLHFQGRRKNEKIRERGTTLLAPAHPGSSLAYFLRFSTLKMEAIRSSETSVNTISTRHHIQEDCFLHRHRRENVKSCKSNLVRGLVGRGGGDRVGLGKPKSPHMPLEPLYYIKTCQRLFDGEVQKPAKPH
jgi:hypothetical protein